MQGANWHLLLNWPKYASFIRGKKSTVCATNFAKDLKKIRQVTTTFRKTTPFWERVHGYLTHTQTGKPITFFWRLLDWQPHCVGVLLWIVAVLWNSTKRFWSILSCNLAKKCCNKKHQQRSEKLKLWITILCSPAIQCVRQRQRCSK